MTTKDKSPAPTAKASEDAPSTGRKRSERRKVYERVSETEIPEELVAHFKKDDYDLKLIRWCLNGEEDYRYLAKREKEGYEFVRADELPDWYIKSCKLIDTRHNSGLVTLGDLCLTKIDSDLRKSRSKAYQDDTDREVAAVDIHVLEKKHGFRNLGTKSKVMVNREPSFQD